MRIDRRVSSEISVGTATARLIDYHWHEAGDMTLLSDRPILHRRAYPNDINVLAECDKRTRRIGELIFLPARTALTTITQLSERASAVACLFDPDWFATVTELPRDWDGGDLTQCIDLRNVRLDQAMRWLERELHSPNFGIP